MPKSSEKPVNILFSRKFKKLKEDFELVKNMTNDEICEKYNISGMHLNRFKQQWGLDNPTKEYIKPDETQERLKRIEDVDTSKLTQKELQSLLGFSSRASVSYFCKKNNIPFATKRKLNG